MQSQHLHGALWGVVIGISGVICCLLPAESACASESAPKESEPVESVPDRYAALLDALGDWADENDLIAEQAVRHIPTVRGELNALAALCANNQSANNQKGRTEGSTPVVESDAEQRTLLKLDTHWTIARDRLQPAYLGLVLLKLRIDEERADFEQRTQDEIKAREKGREAERLTREKERAEKEKTAGSQRSSDLFGGSGLFGNPSSQRGSKPITAEDILRAERRRLRDEKNAVASGNARLVDSRTGSEVSGREARDYWRQRRQSHQNPLTLPGTFDGFSGSTAPSRPKPAKERSETPDATATPTLTPRAALEQIDAIVVKELARLNPAVMKVAEVQLLDKNPDQRSMAVQGLGYWSGNRKQILSIIERALGDEDQRVQASALAALIHMKLTDVELRQYMKSNDVRLRAATLSVLELRKPGDKLAASISSIGFTDDEKMIRTASYALVDTLLPEAVDRAEVIRPALASKSADVVLDALEYISRQPDSFKKPLMTQINRLKNHAYGKVKTLSASIAQ